MLFSTLITPIEVNSRGTVVQHFQVFHAFPTFNAVKITFLTLHNGSKSSELVFLIKNKR